MKNILEYLEKTALRLPDKVALTDGVGGASLTFSALLEHARCIGSALCRAALTARRVAVLMERHPEAVAAMLGAVYAGTTYVPLDSSMPSARAEYILRHSRVAALICDRKNADAARAYGLPVLLCDELLETEADEARLEAVRRAQTVEDELYIIFTSGSTGLPKGVVGCHRAVIDYAEALTETLGFDETCVFGCQSPLYFDAPLKELLSMMRCGASVCLVPRRLFSFPVPLLRYLKENGVNTICWVSSALSSVAVLGGLAAEKPTALRTVVFGSEALPLSHYRAWREALPTAQFWQLYGPTEATGMSCYFKADRAFSEGERIPIGRPFDRTGLFLLGDDGKIADNEGEICLFGDCLTLGYDNDKERTDAVFVSMRCEDGVERRVYRTGDLARYNARGELEFLGRRDGQIKRMGHRIELGEIESASLGCEGVLMAACAVRAEDAELLLYYVGSAQPEEVAAHLGAHLPRYMLPRRCCAVDVLPHTENGKIDRRALSRMAWGEN